MWDEKLRVKNRHFGSTSSWKSLARKNLPHSSRKNFHLSTISFATVDHVWSNYITASDSVSPKTVHLCNRTWVDQVEKKLFLAKPNLFPRSIFTLVNDSSSLKNSYNFRHHRGATLIDLTKFNFHRDSSLWTFSSYYVSSFMNEKFLDISPRRSSIFLADLRASMEKAKRSGEFFGKCLNVKILWISMIAWQRKNWYVASACGFPLGASVHMNSCKISNSKCRWSLY